MMRRATVGVALAAMTAIAGGVVTATTASATVPEAAVTTSVTAGAFAATGSAATAAPPTGLRAPWSRELVRLGQQDRDPYNIAHVRELQYRLKWVGLFKAVPTGYFGEFTRNAVKAFQARRHLAATGVANQQTWKLLLQRTVRRADAIPANCKNAGWHACYDRTAHQVTLWHDGSIYNTWLVRGGSYTTQTRLGTHVVYYRDADHVSSQFGSPMPYSQFFDGGEALHGSRLMMDPFVDHSHGCINMYVEDSRQLWNLTHDKRLVVTVYGAWD